MNSTNKISIDVGCGDFGVPGTIWTDADKRSNADVIAFAHQLPYKNKAVDEIYCYHVLEHLNSGQKKAALHELSRVLKRGGKLFLRMPHFSSHKSSLSNFEHQMVVNSDTIKNSLRTFGLPLVLDHTELHFICQHKPPWNRWRQHTKVANSIMNWLAKVMPLRLWEPWSMLLSGYEEVQWDLTKSEKAALQWEKEGYKSKAYFKNLSEPELVSLCRQGINDASKEYIRRMKTKGG